MHDLQLSDDLFPRRVRSGNVHNLRRQSRQDMRRQARALDLTFFAMIALVGTCKTLETVPPLPLPSSSKTCKSSFLRSSLNSTPNSRVASCSLSLLWYDDLTDVVDEDEPPSDGVVGMKGEIADKGDASPVLTDIPDTVLVVLATSTGPLDLLPCCTAA